MIIFLCKVFFFYYGFEEYNKTERVSLFGYSLLHCPKYKSRNLFSGCEPEFQHSCMLFFTLLYLYILKHKWLTWDVGFRSERIFLPLHALNNTLLALR